MLLFPDACISIRTLERREFQESQFPGGVGMALHCTKTWFRVAHELQMGQRGV